jgi:hypothetical protein
MSIFGARQTYTHKVCQPAKRAENESQVSERTEII